MVDIPAKIIESGNFLFVIGALFGAYSVVKWEFTRHLNENTQGITRAWTVVFMASGLNHLWFAMSRHLSSNGNPWNLAMYDLRPGAVMVTALMFALGMICFIGHIEGFGLRKKLTLFGVAVLAAAGLGFY